MTGDEQVRAFNDAKTMGRSTLFAVITQAVADGLDPRIKLTQDQWEWATLLALARDESARLAAKLAAAKADVPEMVARIRELGAEVVALRADLRHAERADDGSGQMLEDAQAEAKYWEEEARSLDRGW